MIWFTSYLSNAECVGVDSLRNINAIGHLVDGFQGTLNSIENCAHDARPELDGKWFASAEDGVSDGDAGSFLVDLFNDSSITRNIRITRQGL